MSASILHLPDTTLISVRQEGDTVALGFSPAIIVKSEGIPLVDSSTRWTQDGELVIGAAEVEGDWPALPVVLKGGSIEARGYKTIDMLQLPMVDEGYVRLRLDTGDGSVLVTGTGIRLRMDGMAKYIRHLLEE